MTINVFSHVARINAEWRQLTAAPKLTQIAVRHALWVYLSGISHSQDVRGISQNSSLVMPTVQFPSKQCFPGTRSWKSDELVTAISKMNLSFAKVWGRKLITSWQQFDTCTVVPPPPLSGLAKKRSVTEGWYWGDECTHIGLSPHKLTWKTGPSTNAPCSMTQKHITNV